MKYELKPCPFCGAEARMWKWSGGVRVDCSLWSDNFADVHYVGVSGRTEEEAAEKWNERRGTCDSTN